MMEQSSLALASKRILQLVARLRHKCKRPLAIENPFRRLFILQVPRKPFFRTGKVDGHCNNTAASLLGVPAVGLIGEKILQGGYQKGTESTDSRIGRREHGSL